MENGILKIQIKILICPNEDYWKFDMGIPIFYDYKRNLVEFGGCKYFPDSEFIKHTINLAKVIRARGKIVKIWKNLK